LLPERVTVPVGDNPPTVVTVAIHVPDSFTASGIGVQRRVVVVGERIVVSEVAAAEGLEGNETRSRKTSAIKVVIHS